MTDTFRSMTPFGRAEREPIAPYEREYGLMNVGFRRAQICGVAVGILATGGRKNERTRFGGNDRRTAAFSPRPGPIRGQSAFERGVERRFRRGGARTLSASIRRRCPFIHCTSPGERIGPRRTWAITRHALKRRRRAREPRRARCWRWRSSMADEGAPQRLDPGRASEPTSVRRYYRAMSII